MELVEKMIEENKVDLAENTVKISKFKKFLHIVFGDLFFKLLAIAGAVLVFLTFKMVG